MKQADPPALRPKPRRTISEKQLQKDAERTSGALIETSNSLVAAAFGDECRMNKLERQTIEEPLANILARMEPEALEAITSWTDPLVLSVGLFAWGTRVAKVVQKREMESAELEAAELAEQPLQPEQPVAPTNGRRPGEAGFVPSAEQMQRALGGV